MHLMLFQNSFTAAYSNSYFHPLLILLQTVVYIFSYSKTYCSISYNLPSISTSIFVKINMIFISYLHTLFFIRTNYIRTSKIDLPKNKNNVRTCPASDEKKRNKKMSFQKFHLMLTKQNYAITKSKHRKDIPNCQLSFVEAIHCLQLQKNQC